MTPAPCTDCHEPGEHDVGYCLIVWRRRLAASESALAAECVRANHAEVIAADVRADRDAIQGQVAAATERADREAERRAIFETTLRDVANGITEIMGDDWDDAAEAIGKLGAELRSAIDHGIGMEVERDKECERATQLASALANARRLIAHDLGPTEEQEARWDALAAGACPNPDRDRADRAEARLAKTTDMLAEAVAGLREINEHEGDDGIDNDCNEADVLIAENRGAPICATCGKLATCLGEYEDCTGVETYACDDCCDHGNEDGHCSPVALSAHAARKGGAG